MVKASVSGVSLAEDSGFDSQADRFLELFFDPFHHRIRGRGCSLSHAHKEHIQNAHGAHMEQCGLLRLRHEGPMHV